MNEKAIEVLNSLVEINNDRIEGYKTAGNETTEPDLQALFGKLQQTSMRNNGELRQCVRAIGGTPEEGTRISGKFFRAWMDVKVAFSNNDRKTILNSCEYGEDVALKTYRRALENDAAYIDDEHQEIIRKQLELLQRDHDEVKSLCEAARRDEDEDDDETGENTHVSVPITGNVELPGR